MKSLEQGEALRFPFLRTFKPVLKRARAVRDTAPDIYEDVRLLLSLWLHQKRIRRLLDHQNASLLAASQERDRLLHDFPHMCR